MTILTIYVHTIHGSNFIYMDIHWRNRVSQWTYGGLRGQGPRRWGSQKQPLSPPHGQFCKYFLNSFFRFRKKKFKNPLLNIQKIIWKLFGEKIEWYDYDYGYKRHMLPYALNILQPHFSSRYHTKKKKEMQTMQIVYTSDSLGTRELLRIGGITSSKA